MPRRGTDRELGKIPKKKRRNLRYVTRPLTRQELRKLAAQLVNAQINPLRRELASQQRIQGRNVRGFTKGLVSELGDIGGDVRGIYDTAQQENSALAKGFSDGLRMLQGENAQATGSFLENVAGANPEQVAQATGQGQGAADVLFGTAGVIPGQSLNARGAAAETFARQLPAFAGMRGQQASIQADREYASALTELQRRRSELMREVMNDLIQQELSKRGLAINAGYLANAQAGTALDAISLQQDAANDARDARGKKGEKRQEKNEFFNKQFDLAADIAENLLNRTKPNPLFGDPNHPNQPKTIPDPVSFNQAFKHIRGRIWPKLKRQGFSRARVEREVRQLLLATGYTVGSGTGSPTKGGQGPQE